VNVGAVAKQVGGVGVPPAVRVVGAVDLPGVDVLVGDPLDTLLGHASTVVLQSPRVGEEHV
jgi:hypothetical protein